MGVKLLQLSDKFESGKFKDKKVSVVINKGEQDYIKRYWLPRNKDYRLHKDVVKLAQSKTQLKLSNGIIERVSMIFSNDNDYIAKKLLYLNNRKRINSIFTNVRIDKNDVVKFDTVFGNKNSSVKIGRLIGKLFESNGIEYSNQQIEDFVSRYRSYNIAGEFKILKGEEIRWAYLVDNYHSYGGSLGSSCMRHQNCQHRLDLYVYNPDNIEMLALINKVTGKVMGRAIIWKNVKMVSRSKDIDETNDMMDRIYVNTSGHVEMFKNYARENGISFKKTQSYSSHLRVIHKGKLVNDMRMTAKLNDLDLNKPYLDTFNMVKSHLDVIENY